MTVSTLDLDEEAATVAFHYLGALVSSPAGVFLAPTDDERAALLRARTEIERRLPKLDTSNDSLVAVIGDHMAVMHFDSHMTYAKALRLAAWLAVLADPEGDEFAALLDAVRNT